MTRSIDLSALTRAERVVLVAGATGFLNGLIPWWYRVSTTSHTYAYNAGFTGWGIVTVSASLLAAIGCVVRATVWPRPAPRWDGTAYAFLGFIAFDALAAQTNQQAGHQWIGMYVGMMLSLTLLVAGFLRRRAHRRGWA